MKTDRRGFAPIAIAWIVIATIAVIGVVFYYFHHSSSKPAPSPVVTNPPVVATSTPTSTQPVAPSSTAPTSTQPIPGGAITLSPLSGPVGTQVTIHGSGFAATGNTITLGGLVGESMTNVASLDGKTLIFTVPSGLGPNCKPTQPCPDFIVVTSPRTYAVAVISNGVTRSAGSFTVTGGGTGVPEPSL